MASKPRARPAHAPGPTYLAYTPNGNKLITVGLNNVVRIFTTGSDAEPVNIDVVQDSHTAVAATNDFFLTGSEDGSVCKYSLFTHSLEEVLVRSTLAIRDISISPDGLWAAVASDELVVKIVNTYDMTRVMYLRDQTRPVKHVSFDHSGSNLAVSCSDGMVYIYSLSSEEPKLVKRLDGLIKIMETDSQASSKVTWHPDGRALCAPTPTKIVQVVSRSDWSNQKTFKADGRGDITAATWSPNGALLATASDDLSIILWNTSTQQPVIKFNSDREPVLALAWHPTENLLSYTTNDGELYMHASIIPQEHEHLLRKTLVSAPFLNERPTEDAMRTLVNGGSRPGAQRRAGTPDSLDDILGDDGLSENGDAFIVDDDGAGYAEEMNGNGKRPGEHIAYPPSKRPQQYGGARWQPRLHDPFQPGSTPWRGNRRYLCLNLTGFIWTVDQDTHHTVTVEFYDRAAHRDFHFTDPFLYDKACLGEHGAAFSCPSSDQHPSLVYFRPHETWTSRTDWRTQLPAGEEVTSLSLSTSFVVVTTSKGYVRVYTLYGLPFKVYRQKSTPAVACASWRDYVLTVGNGPIGGDGTAKLVYTIENVKRDEVCQSEDIIPLPEQSELQSVFWSDRGDPCIYDSEGVLLVCLHWRTPGQAKWVPLLDTNQLDRLASGRKEEAYWPVAVAMDKFHCIILKGGEKYPYFPRPLLSDFEFKIPVTARDEENQDESEESDVQKLEEQYVRSSVLLSLQDDLVNHTHATHAQKTEAAQRELDVDKVLLQLLAAECREGEERGMKALELVSLMKDRSGKMLEAAVKIAARFERDVLGEKISALAERRLVGLADEEEEL
ncbi:sepB protein, partial [Aureobasidium melanogenum]